MRYASYVELNVVSISTVAEVLAVTVDNKTIALDDANGALAQVVPFDVRMFPLVPGATNEGVEVPLPRMTLLAVRVARPVPPCATVTAAAVLSNVPVAVGRVLVPAPLTMVEIIGAVSVLLVRVSDPANVDNVPLVGNVTEVVLVSVNVIA